MLRRLLPTAAALLLTACVARTDGRSQLEASLGVPPALAGDLSATELATIHRLQNRSDLTRHERERRVQQVLRGRSPIVVVGR